MNPSWAELAAAPPHSLTMADLLPELFSFQTGFAEFLLSRPRAQEDLARLQKLFVEMDSAISCPFVFGESLVGDQLSAEVAESLASLQPALPPMEVLLGDLHVPTLCVGPDLDMEGFTRRVQMRSATAADPVPSLRDPHEAVVRYLTMPDAALPAAMPSDTVAFLQTRPEQMRQCITDRWIRLLPKLLPSLRPLCRSALHALGIPPDIAGEILATSDNNNSGRC